MRRSYRILSGPEALHLKNAPSDDVAAEGPSTAFRATCRGHLGRHPLIYTDRIVVIYLVEFAIRAFGISRISTLSLYSRGLAIVVYAGQQSRWHDPARNVQTLGSRLAAGPYAAEQYNDNIVPDCKTLASPYRHASG